MKIVHSFWSAPHTSHKYIREEGEWVNRIFFYYSWALSCLQFTKFYRKVALYTDKIGKELLIDKIGLPYSEVHVVLDDIMAGEPIELWALGKLHVYKMQEEPFLHVDGDVYVWDKFPARIENAPLAAQHQEQNFSFYETIIGAIFPKLAYLPEVIRVDRQAFPDLVLSYNAGVFGGHDLDFFKDYSDEALQFVAKNRKVFADRFPLSHFNIIYEQYLFGCMVRQMQQDVTCYFESMEENFTDLLRFRGVPHRIKYIHALSAAKKDPSVMYRLMARIRHDYPKYFYKIKDLYEMQEI